MANEGMKISQLPAATEVLDSDVLAGVGGGVTRKFTLATIFNYIKSKLSPSTLNAAPADSVAVTEETSTATQAHAVGSLLFYDGTLYRVTSAISIGGTITPGTNVTATDISDQLIVTAGTRTALTGALYGNGSTVEAKASVPTVTITKTAYDNLSAADKAKDILYNIIDDESSENYQPIITANGVLQGNGGGGVTAKAVDNTPTANSTNLVTSGGVKSAIDALFPVALDAVDASASDVKFSFGGKEIYFRAMTIASITAGDSSYAQLRASDTNSPGVCLLFGGYYSPNANTNRNLPYSNIGIRAEWVYASSKWRIRITVDNGGSSDLSDVIVWAFYTTGT